MGDKTVTIFIAYRTHDALYHIILRLTVSIIRIMWSLTISYQRNVFKV